MCDLEAAVDAARTVSDCLTTAWPYDSLVRLVGLQIMGSGARRGGGRGNVRAYNGFWELGCGGPVLMCVGAAVVLEAGWDSR